MRRLITAALAAVALLAGGAATAQAAPVPAATTVAVAAVPAAAPAGTVSLAELAQGGSGTFYYGPANSGSACGYYGQATNYNNSSGGQTYHWAFKSMDSGYRTTSIVFKGTGGKTIATNGATEGYTSFGSAYKGVDYVLVFYVSNGVGPCYVTLGNSWQ